MQPHNYQKLARNKFFEIEQWLYSEKTAEKNFTSVENGIESNGRELLRILLQAYIEKLGDGTVGESIDYDWEGEVLRFRRKRCDTRSLITLFGKITISRAGYYHSGHQAIHPLDKQLQLPKRAYSYELQRRIVKMAAQGPFDETVSNISETMGIVIPKRSAEELLIDAASYFDTFYTQKRLSQHCFSDTILVASVDCKGIPLVKNELANNPIRRKRGEKPQKKKMATVASVYTQEPYYRTPKDVVNSLFHIEERSHESRSKDRCRCHDKRVWASLISSKDYFISDVVSEVQRRKKGKEKTIVVVTDGERALQIRIGNKLKNVTMVLDLAHVMEYLWKVSYVFHKEGSDEAIEFVKY